MTDHVTQAAEMAANTLGPRFNNWWQALRRFQASPDLGSTGNFCGECGMRGSTNPNTDNCAACDAAISSMEVPSHDGP